MFDRADLDRISVVLVSTRNPLNIGAAARAMSNFGILDLRVVNPFEASFREARSAVGAAPLLEQAKEFSSVAEAVTDCSLVVGTTAVGHRELQHPLYRTEQAAPLIQAHIATERVALLFGSEKRGLSNDDLSHCHWSMHIATRQEHLSMNLGQAVAVCLYELVRENASTIQTHFSQQARAKAGEEAILTSKLLQALQSSGYIHPGQEANTEETMRRLVKRMSLSSDDARLWLGILRQIGWKLDTGKRSEEES